MTLQSSGAISFQQINVELQLSPTSTISLNDAAVRQLLGKSSGTISMQDAYGKKNEVRFVNTEARTSVSIYELMGSPTVPSNYIFENKAEIKASTTSYALRTGVFPSGSTLTIINSSYIRGMGGAGSSDPATAGGAGGDAIYIDMPCHIDNTNGYIFAGGGGGGSAKRVASASSFHFVKAGGGGGAGSNSGAAGVNSYKSPNPTTEIVTNIGAMPGNTSPGSGGAMAVEQSGQYSDTAYGGTGGENGVSGTIGRTIAFNTPSYFNTQTIGVAGAAGRAITKNGKTLTQVAGFDSTRVKGAIV